MTTKSSVPPCHISVITSIIGNRPQLSQSFLHENYVKKGLKVEQIAALTNSSKYAVKKTLRASGLTNQKRHKQRLARKSSPPITEIKRLRDSGLSMREIAEEMVKYNRPNLSGGKSWHPMMVQRLLKINQEAI